VEGHDARVSPSDRYKHGFNTRGPRYDVTPLFADYAAFVALVDDLTTQLGGLACDLVAGIDALGFILGTALAMRLGTGFLAIRKEGKLSVAADAQSFVDYTGLTKTLELRRGALRAASALIERQGGIVAGVATINLDDNERKAALRTRYPSFSVWRDQQP